MEYIHQIERWQEEHEEEYEIVVGVVGKTEMTFQEEAEITGFLNATFSSLRQRLDSEKIIVVSHGTRKGTPKAATVAACQAYIQVLGIHPEKAEWQAENKDFMQRWLTYAHPVGPVAGRLSEYGDEKPHFARYLTHLVILGGGPGTAVIVWLIADLNNRRSKNESPGEVATIIPVTIPATEGHLVTKQMQTSCNDLIGCIEPVSKPEQVVEAILGQLVRN